MEGERRHSRRKSKRKFTSDVEMEYGTCASLCLSGCALSAKLSLPCHLTSFRRLRERRCTPFSSCWDMPWLRGSMCGRAAARAICCPTMRAARWSARRSSAPHSGARLLALLEHPQTFHWQSLCCWTAGRTIIGGILGGWIAVELVKRRYNIHSRTGELFVTPLAVGLIFGRIGCFLAGTADDTFGRATTLPWGVDFGDGLARHPLQLYEIAFLLLFFCCRASCRGHW